MSWGAAVANPTAVVWRASQELPPCRRGVKMLGSLSVTKISWQPNWRCSRPNTNTSLCRIPFVQNVASGPLCGRLCHFVAKVVDQGPPNLSVGGMMLGCGSVCSQFHRSHQIKEKMWLAQLRCRWFWGGLGLRSACTVSQPAHWASWANAVHVIHNCHPEVARGRWQPTCQSTCEDRDAIDEASCKTSSESSVGSHVGVCGSQGSGFRQPWMGRHPPRTKWRLTPLCQSECVVSCFCQRWSFC